MVATLDSLDLIIISSTFIFIVLARLDLMSKLDNLGMIAGYLLYYSTVTILINDLEIEPPSSSKKF